MFHSVQDVNEEIISLIYEHLTTIDENFEKYFPLLNTEQFDWIRNPFVSFDFSSFTLNEEELTSLSSDRGLKLKFTENTPEKFWISVKDEYPGLAEKALNILLLFSTSYLCEVGFLTMVNIKTKKHQSLGNLEEEMRVALSFIRPNISEICKDRQAQVSH